MELVKCKQLQLQVLGGLQQCLARTPAQKPLECLNSVDGMAQQGLDLAGLSPLQVVAAYPGQGGAKLRQLVGCWAQASAPHLLQHLSQPAQPAQSLLTCGQLRPVRQGLICW